MLHFTHSHTSYALRKTSFLLRLLWVPLLIHCTHVFSKSQVEQIDHEEASLRWSDPTTWPDGKVPANGANVLIPANQSILLDVERVNIGQLIIEGQLIFDEKDIALTTRWILVKGKDALLQIGTEDQPYTHKAYLTIDGPKEDVSGFGGRFIVAIDGGSIELHGNDTHKLNWTQLNSTVLPGATELELAETPKGWKVGDQVILAPSGFEPDETEELTITSVSGNRIGITPALAHKHYGEIFSYQEGEIEVDQRAEIGMLSRNIVISGEKDAETERWGAHIMILNTAGPIHIEGVELTRTGQPGNEGRYSMHWHLCGDRAGDYIKNSSIHHSMQRGVVVHSTNQILVEGVVAGNIFNHAFIPAEDGDEVSNIFRDNLAVNIRVPLKDERAFPKENSETLSLQGEHRPSGFWMRSVFHELTGNHVAGIEKGVGFFYDSGFRAKKNQELDYLGLPIIFDDNVAHSITFRGNHNVATYLLASSGIGLFVDKFKQGDFDWVFSGFSGYKIHIAGVWNESNQFVLDNTIVSDIGSGLMTGPGKVKNTVVIGQTPNDIGKAHGIRHKIGRAGLSTQGMRSTKQVPQLENVTFIDLNLGVTKAPEKEYRPSPALATRRAMLWGSTTKNITLINTEPLWMILEGAENKRSDKSGFLYDQDGTLSGYNRPMALIPYNTPLENVNSSCISHPEWRAYACDGGDMMLLAMKAFDTKGKRIALNILEPAHEETHTDHRFTEEFGGEYNLFEGRNYSVDFYKHNIFEGSVMSEEEPVQFLVKSLTGLADKFIHLSIPYPFESASVIDGNGNQIQQKNSLAEVSSSTQASFYFDKKAKLVHVKAFTNTSGESIYRIYPDAAVITSINLNENNEAIEVYPNPGKDLLTLTFSLSSSDHVVIDILDVAGRKVDQLINQKLGASEHQIEFDASRLPGGLYVYQLKTSGQIYSGKILLKK